jgi:peptidoglycan-associated lipoprotein
MPTRSSLAMLSFGTSLALSSAACGHEPTAPPAQTPEGTRTSQGPVNATRQRSYEGNDVSVSSELVRVCKIQFGNVDRAPKFDFDNSSLLPQDRNVLEQIARCVTTGPLAGRRLTLVGRADPQGTVEYNFALGERRAASVTSYLGALGVDKAKMVETSRGELDAVGRDEAGWQRDRRVDISLP